MIRDIYFIVAATGQCVHHQSYSRTPVDEALVSGFFSAMGSIITSMPEGQIKSVPAGTYKFTYTHAQGFLYVVCSDTDDDSEKMAERLQKVKDVMVQRYNAFLRSPNVTKEQMKEMEDHVNKLLLAEIKVALVGFGGVGKTTMYSLVQGSDIPLDYLPTMFVQYKKLDNSGISETEVLLWDFAGQERFTPLWPMLLRGTHVILLCTDSTVENVLQTKRVFISMIRKNKPDAVVYGIANKQDLPNAMSAPLVQRVLGIETFDLCAIDPSERRKLQRIIGKAIETYLAKEKEKEAMLGTA
ncbi:MAG: ADP-ribosylation factor-like protein [Promethearchaeota archaeon]